VIVLLSVLISCGRDGESQQLEAEEKAASQAFDQGDFATAKTSYLRLLDRAKDLDKPESVRSAYLGLAKAQACTGDTKAAVKTYEDFLRTRAQAVEPGNLSLFWDGIELGLVYGALGERAKAEESFSRASQALEMTKREVEWVQPARLLPQWLAMSEKNASSEESPSKEALRQALRAYRDRYPTLVTHWLKWQVDALEICGWDRQIATIKEFVREVGAEDDPIWSYRR